MRGLFFILVLTLLHQTTWGQDVIYKKNGDTLNTKVIRIEPAMVTYRRFNNPDTFLLTIAKSDINYIIYQNGTSDTFRSQSREPDAIPHIYKGNYYASTRFEDMGKQDAIKYYKDYRSAKSTMVIASVFMPIASIIPAAIITGTPPKEANLGYPKPELMNNSVYRMAYKEKAFQIKRRKTWNGVLLGTGIILGLESILIVSVISEMSHSR